MTISLAAPTDNTGAIRNNGSDVLTIESDRSIDIDSGTLHVDATNNRVGIGTASPGGKTHIQTASSGGTADVNADELVLEGSGNMGMSFLTSNTGANRIYFGDSDHNVQGVIKYDHSLDAMFFNTNTIERMRIDSSGYVGINGAPNNRAQLEVKAGTSTIHQLFLEQNNTEHGWQFYADQSDGGLGFFRRNNSGQTERMRIKDDGKVGINVTNPLAVLHIKGNNNPTSYFQVDSNGNQAIIFRNVSDTTVGNITVNTSTTAYNTSSDYRLKTNVVPMSGSIDRLKQLKPSTWSWVQDDSHGEGFVAHEAQTVVPEAVTGTKDAVDDEGNPVYQGIDQSKLVPLLTAALQEAITKIEDLETRIQALESN